MKKRLKLPTLKQRVNKIVPVCGRKFKVYWGKGNIGAQFNTIHPQTGGGTLLFGDGPKDEYYQVSNIVHELLEVVMTLRGHRWREEDSKILFAMTHDEYCDVALDFTRALLDSGLLKVNEIGDDVDDIVI